ncbi:serine/threonine protein kinase [Amycolatopsis nalaikhensis]|uniref:non-specific serine/threonine protein kinase n=1 Tax=Amycolatopsis nalaikhensis TaxID=715472 RepID=A0ABY8XQA3_9PSEU|nr:protein kinase [Amycolatopsis sp. 2-2]WIV57788.1 protein kinase [Amycolatopsis sp. 2-2]
MAEPQSGYRVGDDDKPDLYELRRPARVGGEGEVWQAATIRQDGISDHLWAVKILHAKHLLGTGDETMNSALRHWHDRYREAQHETAQLQDDVPGIVGPARVFPGDAPHSPGEPGHGRCLYVVSRWIDGDNLEEWRSRCPRTFDDICDVLTDLASIVDGLAERPQPVLHRDISPDNVMVRPDGQVRLIDFTFVRPPDSSAGTAAVLKRGYTAPEARNAQAGLPSDRYSFGAVAYFLLAMAEPAMENAAAESRAVLLRDGFGVEVADHVAALLATDPGMRPAGLVAWTGDLRKLGSHKSAPSQYRTIALTMDGTSTPIITAASVEAVASVRLGVGTPWRLQTDRTSPRATTSLAAVTDGSGTQITFAIDEGGTVLVGRRGQWTGQGPAVAGGGLAAVRDPQGRAVAYLVDPATRDLTTITVDLDATTHRATTGRPVLRVLSATSDWDGRAALFVLAADGSLACVRPDGVKRVDDGAALDAAGCLDQWGNCAATASSPASPPCLALTAMPASGS